MSTLCCAAAVHGRDAGQAMREIGPDTLAVLRDQVPEARRRLALEERRGRHAMACQGVLRDTDPAARGLGPQVLNPRGQLDGGTEVRDRLRRRLIAVAVDAGAPAPDRAVHRLEMAYQRLVAGIAAGTHVLFGRDEGGAQAPGLQAIGPGDPGHELGDRVASGLTGLDTRQLFAPEGELHPGHGRIGAGPRDLGDGVLEGQERIQAVLYLRPEPERAVVVAGARDRHPFPAVINGAHFPPGCR